MSAKDVRPLGNRALIKRSQARTTKGGILLPETAQEKPKHGEVVAVGPGKTDDNGTLSPMNIRVGDQVLFSSYAGTEVKTDEQDTQYLILSEDDILVVLN